MAFISKSFHLICSFRQTLRYHLKVGHDRFFQHSSQSIIYSNLPIRCYKTHVAEKAPLNKPGSLHSSSLNSGGDSGIKGNKTIRFLVVRFKRYPSSSWGLNLAAAAAAEEEEEES
jgi:hypothetical protein